MQDLMWVRAFVLPVDIVRTFLFTAIGVSCCVAAGIVAFPLLRPDLGSQGTTVRRSLVAPVSISLLVAGTWIAYTALLFNVAEPELTNAARRLFGESDVSHSMATAILAVSACAFGEELIFRLGIQHYIARLFGWWDRRYWLAILLSATALVARSRRHAGTGMGKAGSGFPRRTGDRLAGQETRDRDVHTRALGVQRRCLLDGRSRAPLGVLAAGSAALTRGNKGVRARRWRRKSG